MTTPPAFGATKPQQVLAGLPPGLRDPLVEEFNKILRNFRERRWEPAELNGGRFCEIAYSILRGRADEKYPPKPAKPRNLVKACAAIEQEPKGSLPRSLRIQIPRMLVALYEIRNNRNVGHVGGDVDPSEQDATVVLSMAQWIMAEFVRVFHDVTLEEAARVVESLVERRLPLVWRVHGKIRVLDPGLSSRDQALVLLYSASGSMDVDELIEAIEYGNPSRFRRNVLSRLHGDRLLDYDKASDVAAISPRGIAYVEESIPLILPSA